MYNGSFIRPNSTKIKRDRRKKIGILMVMDKMKDHINKFLVQGRGRGRSSRT
jgi:hypothetical protein